MSPEETKLQSTKRTGTLKKKFCALTVRIIHHSQGEFILRNDSLILKFVYFSKKHPKTTSEWYMAIYLHRVVLAKITSGAPLSLLFWKILPCKKFINKNQGSISERPSYLFKWQSKIMAFWLFSSKWLFFLFFTPAIIGHETGSIGRIWIGPKHG